MNKVKININFIQSIGEPPGLSRRAERRG